MIVVGTKRTPSVVTTHYGGGSPSKEFSTKKIYHCRYAVTTLNYCPTVEFTFTVQPTPGPTVELTFAPTKDPTTDPITEPTIVPTVEPTFTVQLTHEPIFRDPTYQ